MKWNVAALRCPEFIRIALDLWDDGIHLKVASYKPVSFQHGRCSVSEVGVCVWQRPHGGEVACASPDLKPALWSMDRNPMDFYFQECPFCKTRVVYSVKNRICPNKKCANKRPWGLVLIDRCRFYDPPKRRRKSEQIKARVTAKQTPTARAGGLRAQHTKPRVAVYSELKACMTELAASKEGFVVNDGTLTRLAGIAKRRARTRSTNLAESQKPNRKDEHGEAVAGHDQGGTSDGGEGGGPSRPLEDVAGGTGRGAD